MKWKGFDAVCNQWVDEAELFGKYHSLTRLIIVTSQIVTFPKIVTAFLLKRNVTILGREFREKNIDFL